MKPLSLAPLDSFPTEGSLWRRGKASRFCQGLPYEGRWHAAGVTERFDFYNIYNYKTECQIVNQNGQTKR